MRDVQDARQRAALLAGNDVLSAQYRDMVDGGVVTEEVGYEYKPSRGYVARLPQVNHHTVL